MSACQECRWFEGEPQETERTWPGLAALSSAFGASCAGDGVCGLLGRAVAGRAWCGKYEAKEAVLF
jgi:hypothetical protein